jgi:hypothetical protein
VYLNEDKKRRDSEISLEPMSVARSGEMTASHAAGGRGQLQSTVHIISTGVIVKSSVFAYIFSITWLPRFMRLTFSDAVYRKSTLVKLWLPATYLLPDKHRKAGPGVRAAFSPCNCLNVGVVTHKAL